MNYVLVTSDDFLAFARNPHGLMELGFRDPQLHTTVLPHLINMPTLRTFLAPYGLVCKIASLCGHP